MLSFRFGIVTSVSATERPCRWFVQTADKVQTVVYVVVTFFGSMAAAVLLAKFGMESQAKPLVNFQNACCAGDDALTVPQPAQGSCCTVSFEAGA